METMLMNPATGSVFTKSEAISEFNRLSAEEWGGENFEDAGLIEVVKDANGDWIEAYPPLSSIS